ncbi:protein C1orf43 homolog isoform X2 [Ambystoma mexicanum]|uniref:protein C1orf43 homolog isoform X2 n=1 Tax=Ambystoma mexicanum TaxID=8296 RepID=UPI0037E972B2
MQIFVLLFIFVKRQIMRFTMKSRRGPHIPVGHNAPKDMKEEIERRLSKVQEVKYEPQLLSEDDHRLQELEERGHEGCYNYLYRMRALDAIRASAYLMRILRNCPEHALVESPHSLNISGSCSSKDELPFQDAGKHPRSLIGKNFRSYLVELRNSSTPFKGVRKSLIDTLLDGYEAARSGTGVFGKREFTKYQEALQELAAVIKARGVSSQRQHQSAAKDLTIAAEPSTIQVTYLPSSQKSKRTKHFLELKSFKDKYNTLESTL